jgi:hypothetical protein
MHARQGMESCSGLDGTYVGLEQQSYGVVEGSGEAEWYSPEASKFNPGLQHLPIGGSERRLQSTKFIEQATQRPQVRLLIIRLLPQ